MEIEFVSCMLGKGTDAELQPQICLQFLKAFPNLHFSTSTEFSFSHHVANL